MAVTVDMDVSMALYLQFSLKYGCHNQINDWPKNHQVLIQYSSNGGILWKYLHEIHYHSNGDPKYVHVKSRMSALGFSSRSKADTNYEGKASKQLIPKYASNKKVRQFVSKETRK